MASPLYGPLPRHSPLTTVSVAPTLSRGGHSPSLRGRECPALPATRPCLVLRPPHRCHRRSHHSSPSGPRHHVAPTALGPAPSTCGGVLCPYCHLPHDDITVRLLRNCPPFFLQYLALHGTCYATPGAPPPATPPPGAPPRVRRALPP